MVGGPEKMVRREEISVGAVCPGLIRRRLLQVAAMNGFDEAAEERLYRGYISVKLINVTLSMFNPFKI